MKKIILALSAFAFIGVASLAIAQTVIVPQVLNVGPTDLFQDVVGGQPQSNSKYATAAQIAGVPGYHYFGTITTDPSYTVPNGVTDLLAHAAGTITTVTITTEPNPADGKRECWWLDQTTSTLTWTANTGQAIDGSVLTAGIAKNPQCVTYVAASAKWVSSN